MPETVDDRIRRPFEISRANPFGAFRALSRLPGITSLVLLFFLYQVAFTVYPAIWAYFTEARFGWAPAMIGASLAAFGVAMAIVQGALIPRILRWLGETGTVFYGITFNAGAFLALSLVSSGTVAMILTPLTALGAVVTPALQGMMSRTVGDDAQGELMGLLSSTGSLAAIVAFPIMTQTFAAFTAEGGPIYLPGAPFLVSMCLMGICGLLFLSRQRSLAT